MRSQHPHFPRRAAGIVAALVLCALGSAHGAPVTWGTPTQIAGTSDVSLNGTLVGAVNLDGPLATVNGVGFQALDINAGPATLGGFTVDGFFFNQFNPGFSTAGAAAPFTGLSAGYQSLLGTAAAVGGTMTLTMSGLTVGGNYLFQSWVSDSRNQTPPGFTFMVSVDGGGNAETLDPNPSLADGGLGQFLIGSFVADGSSQIITFDNSEVAVINGFQLRALANNVPEPTTLALAGLALAGLGLSRRRAA